MGFEPQKFFIGVIDLFSVLLPGAVLTFLLKGPLWQLLGYKPGSDEVVIFLVVSYLLGHFIFLIGSAVLDDRIYDPVKAATLAEQVRSVAKDENLSLPGRDCWRRFLSKIIRPRRFATL
jgi:hypothetical protein